MTTNLNHIVQVRQALKAADDLRFSRHANMLMMSSIDMSLAIRCATESILNGRTSQASQGSGARALLQASLANRYPSIGADSWLVSSTQSGRPVLDGPLALDISFSHRKNWLAAAFSQSGKIGIDIEPIPARLDAEAWGLFLHPLEIEGLGRSAPALAKVDALIFWCLKEAWLKASDTAGQVAMRDIHFSATGRLLSVKDFQGVELWQSAVWELASGVILAVCFEKQPP